MRRVVIYSSENQSPYKSNPNCSIVIVGMCTSYPDNKWFSTVLSPPRAYVNPFNANRTRMHLHPGTHTLKTNADENRKQGLSETFALWIRQEEFGGNEIIKALTPRLSLIGYVYDTEPGLWSSALLTQMHGHKGLSEQHQSAKPLDNRENRPGLVSPLTTIHPLTLVTVPAV